MYLYPDDLKKAPMVLLWEMKDIATIGITFIFSIVLVTQFLVMFPLVITVSYGILSIKIEDLSIKDYIIKLTNFFMIKQQIYKWDM